MKKLKKVKKLPKILKIKNSKNKKKHLNRQNPLKKTTVKVQGMDFKYSYMIKKIYVSLEFLNR